jgi:hypothetical protein
MDLLKWPNRVGAMIDSSDNIVTWDADDEADSVDDDDEDEESNAITFGSTVPTLSVICCTKRRCVDSN